jgi:thermosome
MSGENNYQPIFIMPEDSKRTEGREAQKMNIAAAKLVAETVRTTLGPKGMDKMLVDGMGEVTVTNDGVTILEEMNIQHPAGKMMVEIAKTQEEEIGDGTTTAVVLAGELLKKAEELSELNIHPTVIIKGYRMAAETAQKVVNNISEPVSLRDVKTLRMIASTAMTGKGAENAKEMLATLVVDAVKKVAVVEDSNTKINLDDIKLEKKIGGSIDDTELIEGIVIDKERVHSGMPDMIKDAKIALIDSPIEVKNLETESKISITNPESFQNFITMEEEMLKKMVDKIRLTGANVVLCMKGIDDTAQHLLAKHNILAARRVKKSDMERLAKATGAKIVTLLDDLTAKDLGKASVEEVKVGDESMLYVKEAKNAKAVTILITGGTEHVIEETKRAVSDAIGDVAASIKVGKVLGGAGAPEIEISRNLKLFSNKLNGREQLAVQAFAEAMEIIPRTLAENAGLDPIDVLVELKAAHDKGKKWAGINVFTGEVMDAWKEGVIEPSKIKTQALSSASEVATMILRIDDVIAAGKEPMPQGPPQGMPPMQ